MKIQINTIIKLNKDIFCNVSTILEKKLKLIYYLNFIMCNMKIVKMGYFLDNANILTFSCNGFIWYHRYLMR